MPITLKRRSRTLRTDTDSIVLSPDEFSILWRLALAAPEVVAREAFVGQLPEDAPRSRALFRRAAPAPLRAGGGGAVALAVPEQEDPTRVSDLVRSLRHRLDDLELGWIVCTVRGLGYRLLADPVVVVDDEVVDAGLDEAAGSAGAVDVAPDAAALSDEGRPPDADPDAAGPLGGPVGGPAPEQRDATPSGTRVGARDAAPDGLQGTIVLALRPRPGAIDVVWVPEPGPPSS